MLRNTRRVEGRLDVLNTPVLVFSGNAVPQAILGRADPSCDAFRNMTDQQHVAALGNDIRRADEGIESS